MKKIGFVAPWYGENIPGGAELELRGLVTHLQTAGVELEVLATCVKDFSSDWNEDFHTQGMTIENEITVRRFSVRKADKNAYEKINCKLLNQLPLTEKEEEEYFENSIRSDVLCQFISENKDNYSLFVYIPYLFGTTYFGIKVCPEKSVLIPCLHDESYAYMKHMGRVISSLNGIIFHAAAESQLANRLYDLSGVQQAVLGEGMDTEISGDGKRFREKYKIDAPFLLYAGRKNATKNVDTLIRYFAYYKKETGNHLKLVLLGPGKMEIPAGIREDVYDLGFLPMEDKYDAYAAALACCQPSKNESFSLVIMESWLMGRPVMVHEACAVTKCFVQEADGGFYFKNYGEFAEEVDFLMENQPVAAAMGNQGGIFVRNHFSWEVITDVYKRFLEHCSGC